MYGSEQILCHNFLRLITGDAKMETLKILVPVEIKWTTKQADEDYKNSELKIFDSKMLLKTSILNENVYNSFSEN